MKTALMFPGQGAQYVGMGKDLCGKSERAAELYNAANDILGYDLKKICFEGPEEKLVQTKYSQPAILVTSLAYLETIDIEPSASAGLSLGEYTALICAGALDFHDGLKLVQNRADFMQEASEKCNGGMASVIGLDEEPVRRIIEKNNSTLDIANLNCPGQVVVSGLAEEIDRIKTFFISGGAKKVISLNVNGPFHSRFMEPARIKLKPHIENTDIKAPAVKFFSNVTGNNVAKPDKIKEYLLMQVTSPVYWERIIRNMITMGIDAFIEPAPGKILTGLLRRINKEAKIICC